MSVGIMMRGNAMAGYKQQLGRVGEEMAARYLVSRGYRIVERNYRCPVGEMDIVARDGAYLAFVEVRTRRGRDYGTPEESITPAKRRKLIEVASTYLQERGLYDVDWRIDVVAIEMAGDGRLLRLALIKGAVSGEEFPDEMG